MRTSIRIQFDKRCTTTRNYSGKSQHACRLYLKSHLPQIRNSSWYWILTREKLELVPRLHDGRNKLHLRLIGKTKNDGISCVNTVVASGGCRAATGYLSCNGARDISVALLNCFVFAWRCQASSRPNVGSSLKARNGKGGGEERGREETRRVIKGCHLI